MVPSWKRVLSWVITTVIATTEKTEKTKDRRLPDVPRPGEDPWYKSDEALDGIKHGTLLAHREIYHTVYDQLVPLNVAEELTETRLSAA